MDTTIVDNFSTIFEAIGILAFALSGLLEAARKRLDIVGMAMVTALAAFGGGTLRDILMDRRPFFWVENLFWVWIILGICVFALFFVRTRLINITERTVQWPDAIGLGIFAAGGTQIALEANLPGLIAVIMGTITAVFGGVLRDIVVNEIPKAFSDHSPYAVIAFTGSWIVVIGNELSWLPIASVLISTAVMVGLRIAVLIRGWRLPTWRVEREG